MILAEKPGMLIAVRVIRETATAVSYQCIDEPGSEYTIGKSDPNRKLFDGVEAAEAWLRNIQRGKERE